MNPRKVILALAAASTLIAAGSALAHGNPSRQRFTFTGKTVRGKDLPITVSATGPISGKGTVRIIEHPQTSTAAFHFPTGTIQVLFLHGPTQTHPDPARCRATIDARGTYTIHGASGRYAGATGKGAYTETRLLLGQRSPAGKCLAGPNATPNTITATATMRGTISLP